MYGDESDYIRALNLFVFQIMSETKQIPTFDQVQRTVEVMHPFAPATWDAKNTEECIAKLAIIAAQELDIPPWD